MRVALTVTLAAACALAPLAAGAQTLFDPAARLSTRDVSAAAQARDTMNRYAECVVKTRAAAVRRALSTETPDAELARLASDDCLASGQLQMGTSLFRGALYRALYLRDFGRDAELPAGEATPAASTNPLLLFGDCVARLDPAQTQAFVVAMPATPGEDEAVAALGASFERCVVAGDRIGFSKTVLQGALAEALYKRSAAAAELAEAN